MIAEGALNTSSINSYPVNGGMLVPGVPPPVAFWLSPFQGSLNGEAINAIEFNAGSALNAGLAKPSRSIPVSRQARTVTVAGEGCR